MVYTPMKSEQTPQFIKQFLKNPHPCYIRMLMRTDEKILIAKSSNDILNNLPDKFIVVDTKHAGGSILGYPDSVCLVAFDNKEPNWINKLVKYLKSLGLNAKNTGNDVLVDGYKVAGFSAVPLEGTNLQYYAFFVSITVNLSDIFLVCKKQMKKIPKGLGEYGITTQDILNALDVE